MAPIEIEAGAVEERIGQASPTARALLWVITRASEPLTERLIERVWSGESVNQEMLHKVAAELEQLPPAMRAQIEAQLPPEVRDQIKDLSREPIAAKPPIAPLLAELLEARLLVREGGVEDAPLGFAPLVADRAGAWMDRHPEERGGRTDAQVWEALSARYVVAFEAMANMDDLAAPDLAAATAGRGLAYLLRAGRFDAIGPATARMVESARAASLRAPLLDELRRVITIARRAELPRPEMLVLEIEALRFEVRYGGDIAAAGSALEACLAELRRAWKTEPRPEIKDTSSAPSNPLEAALDLALEIDLAGESWHSALERLDEIETIKRECGAEDHALSLIRCRRYQPLVGLGELDEAGRVLESALEVFRQVEDGPAEVGTLSRVADLWDERGDAAQAVAAAREALAASERLENAETCASCHENLSTYLVKAEEPAAAREHQLADIIYRVVARSDMGRTLQSLKLDILRAVARGEHYELPRVAQILERPDFVTLKGFLEAQGVPPGPLQDGIDELVGALRSQFRG
jgi:tetratricopeptide (TPR) repeat protein